MASRADQGRVMLQGAPDRAGDSAVQSSADVHLHHSTTNRSHQLVIRHHPRRPLDRRPRHDAQVLQRKDRGAVEDAMLTQRQHLPQVGRDPSDVLRPC
jgi:hypothetical protein